MNNISVIWQTYNKERRARLFGDQVFINCLFDNFTHYDGFENYDLSDGAIVVMPLNYNENSIDELNTDIAKLSWCLIILTSNESGSQNYRNIKHPNMKIWLQTPIGSDEADRFLGFGYPSIIEKVINKKEYEWFFAGQVNHQRRLDCVRELKKLKNGKLIETAGFYQGLPQSEYMDLMSKSKIVLCPGGPATPDSFRLYEALEMGCIPIVDMHYGNKEYNGDYWDKVFGDCPLIKINEWVGVADAIEHELANYDDRVIEISEWWTNKKKEIQNNLLNDIEELRSNK